MSEDEIDLDEAALCEEDYDEDSDNTRHVQASPSLDDIDIDDHILVKFANE